MIIQILILLQYYEISIVLYCVLPECFLSALSLIVEMVHDLCVSSGRAEEEEAVCVSFLFAPAGCNRTIIRALWILGEEESWCSLSCIPGEMRDLKIRIALFCTAVFGWLPFFLSLLCLYSPCPSD